SVALLEWVAALTICLQVHRQRNRIFREGRILFQGADVVSQLSLTVLDARNIVVVDLDRSNGGNVKRELLSDLMDLNYRHFVPYAELRAHKKRLGSTRLGRLSPVNRVLNG